MGDDRRLRQRRGRDGQRRRRRAVLRAQGHRFASCTAPATAWLRGGSTRPSSRATWPGSACERRLRRTQLAGTATWSSRCHAASAGRRRGSPARRWSTAPPALAETLGAEAAALTWEPRGRGRPRAPEPAAAGVLRDRGASVALFADDDLGRQLAPVVALELGTSAVVGCADVVVRDGDVVYVKPVQGGWLERELTFAAGSRTGRDRPARRGAGAAGDVAADRRATAVAAVDRRRPASASRGRRPAGAAARPRAARPAHRRPRPRAAHRRRRRRRRRATTCSTRSPSSRSCSRARWARRAPWSTTALPKERLIGQTGRTVAPELYLALGISGSPHHVAGVQGAEHIVAVNQDEHAPIVSFSDASFVGRLEDVLPALVRQLRGRPRRRPDARRTPVPDFDAIVVGAGPAGTTAALADGPGRRPRAAAGARRVAGLQEHVRRHARGLRDARAPAARLLGRRAVGALRHAARPDRGRAGVVHVADARVAGRRQEALRGLHAVPARLRPLVRGAGPRRGRHAAVRVHGRGAGRARRPGVRRARRRPGGRRDRGARRDRRRRRRVAARQGGRAPRRVQARRPRAGRARPLRAGRGRARRAPRPARQGGRHLRVPRLHRGRARRRLRLHAARQPERRRGRAPRRARRAADRALRPPRELRRVGAGGAAAAGRAAGGVLRAPAAGGRRADAAAPLGRRVPGRRRRRRPLLHQRPHLRGHEPGHGLRRDGRQGRGRGGSAPATSPPSASRRLRRAPRRQLRDEGPQDVEARRRVPEARPDVRALSRS